MTMKRILAILIAVAVGAVCFTGAAQKKGGPGKGKEVLEFKIKYLAQEMNLNTDQTRQFSDLYTKMTDEKFRVFQEVKAHEKKLKSDPNASDAEYEQVNNMMINARLKEAEIEKNYDAKFAKFLSKKQIYQMKQSEFKFRKRMHDLKKQRMRATKRK